MYNVLKVIGPTLSGNPFSFECRPEMPLLYSSDLSINSLYVSFSPIIFSLGLRWEFDITGNCMISLFYYYYHPASPVPPISQSISKQITAFQCGIPLNRNKTRLNHNGYPRIHRTWTQDEDGVDAEDNRKYQIYVKFSSSFFTNFPLQH